MTPTLSRTPMHRVLRVAAVGLLVATPIVLLGGWLAAGAAGAWGALLGMAVPVAFLGITTVTALATARLGPAALGPAVLGSWLAKIVAFLLVLLALRDARFFSRPVFAAVFLAATVGYLALEALVVLRTRTPYVETSTGGPDPL